MPDERAQALPEERGQQLRDQRAAAGRHPKRHGHDARPALQVLQAGLGGRQGRHEGQHQGEEGIRIWCRRQRTTYNCYPDNLCQYLNQAKLWFNLKGYKKS